MRLFGTALVLSVLLATSGCGGASKPVSNRPSAAEVSAGLSKGGKNGILGSVGATGLSKAAIDCIAKALVDSKISDAGLKALVASDKNYQPSAADQAAAKDASASMVKCVSSGLSTP